ncbi:MAG: hypothetical protein QM564_00205 [Bergeyella sp.]
MKSAVSIFTIIFLLSTLMYSCKKETKHDENTLQNGIDSAITSSENETFRLEPLPEQADTGKTVFTSGGNTVISFDTQANLGMIKINGKEYILDHLEFSENNYQITGEGITITAENGNFQEMESDCLYGTFPEISVNFNNTVSKFTDIKVQDCPNYN